MNASHKKVLLEKKVLAPTFEFWASLIDNLFMNRRVKKPVLQFLSDEHFL